MLSLEQLNCSLYSPLYSKSNPERKKAASRIYSSTQYGIYSSTQYGIDPEKKKAASKASHSADPEKKKAASKASYSADPQKKKAASKAHYAKNPTPKIHSSQAYYADNKEVGVLTEEPSMLWQSQSVRCKNSMWRKYLAIC